jgi:hypothetical protein
LRNVGNLSGGVYLEEVGQWDTVLEAVSYSRDLSISAFWMP